MLVIVDAKLALAESMTGAEVCECIVLAGKARFAARKSTAIRLLTGMDAVVSSGMPTGGERLVAARVAAWISLLASLHDRLLRFGKEATGRRGC